MASTIQDKMRYAGVAYQQFLIAINTDQDCLNQARSVFEQHFYILVSQHRKILDSLSIPNPEFLEDSVLLQTKIVNFTKQFECFYVDVFEQFKAQHSGLIDKDSKMAFKCWLQMFDTEYLAYIRQDSVCREYADILLATTQLAQQLQSSDKAG